jgi:hypothetical protein
MCRLNFFDTCLISIVTIFCFVGIENDESPIDTFGPFMSIPSDERVGKR